VSGERGQYSNISSHIWITSESIIDTGCNSNFFTIALLISISTDACTVLNQLPGSEAFLPSAQFSKKRIYTCVEKKYAPGIVFILKGMPKASIFVNNTM
jgi:hypothetical protein